MENTPLSSEILARYFTSECTDEELAEIEKWRKASMENDATFRRYEDVWCLSGTEVIDFNSTFEGDWAVVKSLTVPDIHQKSKLPKPLLYYATRIAAVLIIGLAILFVIYQRKVNSYLSKEVASSRNTRVELEDGTVVWLNKGSELNYPETFDGTTREVFLKGEGFFEVMRDPSKPFIVHTANTLTTVLGTSFNIDGKQAEQAISVTVVTGKVTFSLLGEQHKYTELTPGEQGLWTKGSAAIKEMKADPNAMAWHSGQLVFERTSMESMAKTLSLYYNIQIEFSDKKIGDCRFTGTFQKAGLEEILKTISLTLGIKYEIKEDKVVLMGAGC